MRVQRGHCDVTNRQTLDRYRHPVISGKFLPFRGMRDHFCSGTRSPILTVAVDEWETYETKVATIFSKLLWNKYEEYQNLYLDIALPLLKEKETTDEDFVALCQLRQGAAKYSLAALLELPVRSLVLDQPSTFNGASKDNLLIESSGYWGKGAV
ncbi:uncharacterized protein TNIN_487831 [Trichonephila inaurata madagascariensis]|uniref:Uncharacterized protein n=1 Tax=Trichonephila inaurata madagascariensis TaxID=2747483 RepID=A0A8X6WWP8_9ARAC|nr:uncharacterized protein TNIN_487831 [Trichonephila inaurata madagascariensis]